MPLSLVNRVVGLVGGSGRVRDEVTLERTDDFAFGAALGGPACNVGTGAGFDDYAVPADPPEGPISLSANVT